ncbi:MAG: hypothetical protein FJW35_12855 [Acidobacteria bacterium]|nr:hypothetical protein [Acidobacteriota bacterium]
MTTEQASEAQEPAGYSQPNSSHPEKRPARGMEDVVHLFLTHPPGDATISPAAGKVPSGPEPFARSHPVVSVAFPAPALAKPEMIRLLNANIATLESGLKAIDRAVPCDPSRTIDLLAADSLNQLVVIALEAAADDGMLLRAISQYDWIVSHVPILRKIYPGQAINFSAPPRVFLVAPEFSPQLTCAAHRIQSPRIGCYRYRVIAVPSGTAVFFEGA